MQIKIKYEASWRNSFLDGDNNSPLPKKGRNFIGSMKALKDNPKDNFKIREITLDTVMGVLNRLIGDQRKLYQARQSENYFFSDVEQKITFDDNLSKIINSEIVYIRNMTGSEDQNSFTGMIKSNDPIFSSDYSNSFWGVLTLNLQDLCLFIVDEDFIIRNQDKFDPLSVLEKLQSLDKLKLVEVSNEIKEALLILQSKFPDAEYISNKGMVKPIMFSCSALYLQITRIKRHFDLSNALTQKGGIAGISKRGFTLKDFMARFTTGDKKPIWGNPYLLKEKRKGEGEVISMLMKASGVLEIALDITKEQSNQLKEMIENAGVSSFYLGKKGLAYVESIKI